MRVFVSTDTSAYALNRSGSSQSLSAFQSWSAIHKELRKEKRASRRTGNLSEKSREYLSERHEQVEKRIKKGFLVEESESPGRHPLSSEYDFAEHGLRSHHHPILALFPYYTNRNGKLRTGWQKHHLLKSNAKINALDRPYIKLNDKFIGGFRIDIDRSFGDLDELKDWLDYCEVPWPNVVVGNGLGKGEIIRPHFWYMLHPSDAVWADKSDQRVRKRPIKLVKAIAKAITYQLVEFGADPGGLENMFHGKNPLSPYNDTFVINEHLLSLSDLHDMYGLDLKNTVNNERHKTLNENISIRISKVACDAQKRKRRPILKMSDRTESAARISAQIASGLPLEQSNNLFNASRQLAFDYIRFTMNTDKKLYNDLIENRDCLAESMLEFLCDKILPCDSEKRVLERLASYASSVWDPNHRSLQKAYGAMMHEFDDAMSTKDRQSASARRTNQNRVEGSLTLLRDAHMRLQATGKASSINNLVNESGLSRSTVVRLKSHL